MSFDSFSLRSSMNGQHSVAGPERFLRAEQARTGARIAVLWRQLLLAIMLIEIPLQFDTYLFHNLEDAKFGAISGFNISLTTVCLFFLYLQWLPRIVVQSAPIASSKSLIAYVGFVAFSMLWASDKSRTLFELSMLLQASLIFLYVINNIKARSDLIFVMACLTLGLIIEGTVMVLVRFVGHEIALGPVAFGIGELDHRLTGSFGSPNVAASYIAILLAPLLSLFLIPVSKWLKLLAGIAIVVGGAALVMTMSRGGWLAAGFSLCVLLTMAYRRRWLSRQKLAWLALFVAVFAAGALPVLISRLLGDDNGSAESRVPLNEVSMRLIAQHPLGVGANNWDLAARRYFETRQYREEWFYMVHNHYLLMLTELGWLGFFAYLAFPLSIVSRGWRALPRCDRLIAPLMLGLTGAFLGQMIHMAFDIFNSRSQIQMICLVAALIVVCAQLSRGQFDENETVDEVTGDVPLTDRFSGAVSS